MHVDGAAMISEGLFRQTTELQSASMLPTRYVNLDAARARFGDRVDRLAPFLLRSDPLADEAVSAMAAGGFGRAFAAFEEMLASRSARHPDAPAALTTFLAEASRVPAWVDWPTIECAGDVLFRSGVLGGLVLGAMALPLGYASPGGNKPLAFSGRLTEQAPRRLSETSRFVQAVCKSNGVKPWGDGFKITLKVRLMHAHVRRMLLRTGKWDEAAWGAPINQHDMAATTLLFSMVVLEGLRRFGLVIEHEEAERYMALWRYVGHLSGVEMELLPASQLEAVALAELIRATQASPDSDSRALVTALVDSPHAAARTESEKRAAKYRAQLARGLVRGLVGAELAEQLGVSKTNWENVMHVFRPLARVADTAAHFSTRARKQAVRSGERYWDSVVELGLAAGPYDFRPAERLARARESAIAS